MTKKILISSGLLILLLVQSVVAQQIATTQHCRVILDEAGDVFAKEWLKHTITPDSLAHFLTIERLEWSIEYNQIRLSDSLRISIAAMEKKKARRDAQEFLKNIETRDIIWAVHIRPKTKSNETKLWNESEGFRLVRDFQVERHLVTLELEVSG